MVRGRNSLHFDYEVYEALLDEHGGDVAKALEAGGWKSPPLPGTTVFAQLQEEWTSRGLDTGFKVLTDYMHRDVAPLLHLTLLKNRVIFELTGRNMFHLYLSVSSFMYDWLLCQGREGVDGVTFFALGKRLTQLMREHTHGGLSWVTNRFVERGMRIPPLRLEPPSGEETTAPFGYSHQDQAADSEVGEHVKIFDANAVGFHSSSIVFIANDLPFKMYASCIGGKEILHGQPVVREKCNAYAGLLNDSKR